MEYYQEKKILLANQKEALEGRLSSSNVELSAMKGVVSEHKEAEQISLKDLIDKQSAKQTFQSAFDAKWLFKSKEKADLVSFFTY